MKAIRRRSLPFLLAAAALGFSFRAEADLGGISVSVQAPHLGETYHGYSEFRVLLENRSRSQDHQVRITYPGMSYGMGGDRIRQVTHTVVVAANNRVSVPMWQPPLPATGDNTLRVQVDNLRPETIAMPGRSQHASTSSRGAHSPVVPVFLSSRNLNRDDVEKMITGTTSTILGPENAVGGPDASGRGVLSAWAPDTRRPGSHWLELDYEVPEPVNRVGIYESGYISKVEAVVLLNAAGTEIARVAGRPNRGLSGTGSEALLLRVPLTSEPVKTVRLEFGTIEPYEAVGIDAVEISGPGGDAWAVAARASSSASSSGSSSSPRHLGVPGTSDVSILRAEHPVTDWSQDWLGYTCYDAIIISGQEFGAMPAAARDAVWRYVEAGGVLAILGRAAIPEPWASRAVPIPGGGRRYYASPRQRTEGFPQSVPIPGESRRYYAGFGSCYVFEQERIDAVDRPSLQHLLGAARASAGFWNGLPNDTAAQSQFPVVENIRMPLRGMVVIMLVFVLAIGPANLVVLTRMKRRTWMLWTIPAISFATCLTVFAYSLIHEGVTPDVRTEGITILDQGNRRATSLAAKAFYCPLTPNRGLSFSYDTEVTPLVPEWNYHGSGGSPRDVDWTEGQHLARGWVQARVPAHFLIRKSETRRERLELDRSEGELRVINGLGAAVRTLWLADESGQVYTAKGIGAGERSVLTPDTTLQPAAEAMSLRRLYLSSSHAGQNAALLNNIPAVLHPGTYVAELEGNPFIENGLGAAAGKSRTRAASVVYGILETGGGRLAR